MEDSGSVSVKSVSIKYGLIGALVGIIYFIILDFAGQAGNQALGYAGMIFTIILIVLAHKEFKNDGDGFMSYKQGLSIGTLMSLIGSAIQGVFTYVYVSFINSEFLDVIKEQQVMEMEKRGMSDAEIEQAMEIAGAFMGPVAMMIFTIFFGVLFGFILSLIISAFTKKESPELA